MINREDILELTRRMTPARTCFDRIAGAYINDMGEVEDSIYTLLRAIQQCGLKNDALMELLYEQIADGFPVDYEFAVFVFHGTYDVPLKAKDKERLWESEEVYDFIICTVSPMLKEYEPADPVFGFLYPAFSDRSAEEGMIDIFHTDPENEEEGLLYKILGRRG